MTQNLDGNVEDTDDDYYNSGKVRKRRKEKKTQKDSSEKLVVSQASEGLSIVKPAAVTAVGGSSQSQNNQSNISNGTSSDANSNSESSPTIEVKTGDATDVWTQNQQTIFEWALKQFPKGTDKRWDRIAEHIPGKSKVSLISK